MTIIRATYNQSFTKVLFLLLLFFASSLQTTNVRKVNPKQFLSLYNKYKDKTMGKKQVGEVVYKVQYVPLELKLIQLDKKGAMSEPLYTQYKNDRKHYVEFLLQVSIPNFGEEFLKYETSESSYESRLDYYSFQFKNDIRFIFDQKDTVLCDEFIFERNFGISPNASFVIGTSITKKYSQISVLVNDRVLSDRKVIFDFSNKDIKKLPSLKKYNKWKK